MQIVSVDWTLGDWDDCVWEKCFSQNGIAAPLDSARSIAMRDYTL